MIGKILLDLRRSKGLSAAAVAEKLGIKTRTYSSYENEEREPNISTIIKLADYYNCTTDYLLGRDAPAPLTLIEMIQSDDTMLPLERAFLARYLISDDKQRKWLCDMMRATAAGEAVPEGIEDDPDLIIIRLPLYDMPVSAGTGAYIDDARAELTDFLANEHTDRADFVVRVSGDSMEPDYHTGDMVLVEKLSGGSALHYGEIGAFIVGNETYIKRYEKDGLHSLNKKYDVLRFGEDQSVYLIGRVVGIVSKKDIPSKEDIEAYLALRSFARV